MCPPERLKEQDLGYFIFEAHFNETSVLVERAIQVSQCNNAMQSQVQVLESSRIIAAAIEGSHPDLRWQA